MSTLTATITLKRDGVELPGFPVTRTISYDEVQTFACDEANDGDTTTFSALPTSQIASIKGLYVTANQAVTLRLDAQSDAGVALDSGGVLLVLNGTSDAGASTNATLNNNSGSTALVTGVAVGT